MHLLDERQLARACQLPEPGEAAELALEVAGRPAEALGGRDGMELGERVDELVPDAATLGGRVELRRQLVVEDDAVHDVHHVERNAEGGLVLVREQHAGHPDRRPGERAEESRLSQHVVGRRRQRRARRAAQHEALVAPADQEGDVRVPVPDPRCLDRPRSEACSVEHRLDRLEHEQGRKRLGRRLLGRLHDVAHAVTLRVKRRGGRVSLRRHSVTKGESCAGNRRKIGRDLRTRRGGLRGRAPGDGLHVHRGADLAPDGAPPALLGHARRRAAALHAVRRRGRRGDAARRSSATG